MKLMKYVTLELPTHQGNAETTASTEVILIGISIVIVGQLHFVIKV